MDGDFQYVAGLGSIDEDRTCDRVNLGKSMVATSATVLLGLNCPAPLSRHSNFNVDPGATVSTGWNELSQPK